MGDVVDDAKKKIAKIEDEKARKREEKARQEKELADRELRLRQQELEIQRQMLESQRRLAEAELRKAENIEQQPPPPPVYRGDNSLTSLLILCIVLAGIGFGIYYKWDVIKTCIPEDLVTSVSWSFGAIGCTFREMFAGNFDAFTVCFGEGIGTSRKGSILSLSFDGLNNPISGETYSVPIRITNNLGEEAHGTLIEITGGLECKEDSDVYIIPFEDGDTRTYTFKKTADTIISPTLNINEPLSCDLQSCQRVKVNVGYSFKNTLRTNFVYGTNQANPVKKLNEVGEGPVFLQAEFTPYGNYYNIKDSTDTTVNLRLTLRNTGSGEAKITGCKIEKTEDSKGFLGASNSFDCRCQKTNLDPFQSIICNSGFTVYIDNADDRVKKALITAMDAYHTIIFKINVDYDYTESIEQSVSLQEGPNCQ
jgi:hypothetical protein